MTDWERARAAASRILEHAETIDGVPVAQLAGHDPIAVLLGPNYVPNDSDQDSIDPEHGIPGCVQTSPCTDDCQYEDDCRVMP